MKKQKTIAMLLAVSFLFITGCQKPTENVYSEYVENMEIEVDNTSESDSSESDPDNSFPSYNSDTVTSSETASDDEKKNIKILSVKDFGAVGDGKTDDGEAIAAAVKALYSYDEGSQLVFEKNKTYYVSGTTQNALNIVSLKGMTIDGNNSTILLDGTDKRTYLNLSECENVTVKSFNFDLKLRSHFVGTVIGTYNRDEVGDYIDIKADRDFGSYDKYTYSGFTFGLVADPEGRTSRDFLMLKSFKTIDKNARTYRFYLDFESSMVGGTKVNTEKLKLNDTVILPTPEIAHNVTECVRVHTNSNCTLKDINIWNAPCYMLSVRYNNGPITFENVNTIPAPDEKVNFCSWRDVYHCKTNSDKIIWRNCKSSGNHDDVINISSNIMYVSKVYKNNEVECVWQETNGSYGDPAPGSKVIVWDTDTGKLIGRTTLHRVVNSNTNHYVFKDNLRGIKEGENINITFESDSAPNSEIINCDFEGTFRFHGGPLTVKDSLITAARLWIESISNLEGPIPNNILFENCTFEKYKQYPTFLDIYSGHPRTDWQEGDYRLENIRFVNCKGISKSSFFENGNFDPNSPNYITVIPNLAN